MSSGAGAAAGITTSVAEPVVGPIEALTMAVPSASASTMTVLSSRTVMLPTDSGSTDHVKTAPSITLPPTAIACAVTTMLSPTVSVSLGAATFIDSSSEMTAMFTDASSSQLDTVMAALPTA